MLIFPESRSNQIHVRLANGQTVKLDLRTGKIIGTDPAPKGGGGALTNPPTPGAGFPAKASNAPVVLLVKGDRYYLYLDGLVAAVERKTQKKIWQTRLPANATLIAGGHEIHLRFGNGEMARLDLPSGKIIGVDRKRIRN